LLLNPTDYQTLQPQVEMLVRELAGLGQVEVSSDPAISPGGCRVETQFGVIDQQLETQLRRIEEELTQ
jgi:flagellar assembly protein FliH